MSLNILSIGGSRNVGYFSSIRFLDAGATVTFLLRTPSVFDNDATIQKYLKSGKAHLLKGDALVESDVKHAWDEASKHGSVDVLLFTVGTIPSFKLTKGFVQNPANLVTASLLNALCTMPETSPRPKIITLSSTGLSRTSHAALPFLLKPLYGYLLALAHKDKLGSERVIAYCAGLPWDPKDDGEPGDDIMGPGVWTERKGLPKAGSLRDVVVVRPALFTDGECRADSLKKGKKPAYRASDKDLGGYLISRKDVAHFIVDAVLNRWSEYSGKYIHIGY